MVPGTAARSSALGPSPPVGHLGDSRPGHAFQSSSSAGNTARGFSSTPQPPHPGGPFATTCAGGVRTGVPAGRFGHGLVQGGPAGDVGQQFPVAQSLAGGTRQATRPRGQ